MAGIVLCLIAFCVTFWKGRQSLGAGLVALLTTGYAYGLLRARFPDVATHFSYDVALLALYISRFTVPIDEGSTARGQAARMWTLALIAWPLVCMAYSPLIQEAQPMLIQLVGLRDATVALPLLILGTRMRRSDMDILAPSVAVLNLIALGFALFEYVFGIESLIPRSAVTDIVYMTKDIMGSSESFYRLPSTFLDSHQYGAAMTLSLPFVAHGLESGRRVRILCWSGLASAAVAVFLCGSRMPVIMASAAFLFVLISMRMRASTFAAVGIAAAGVSYLVYHVDRFQRFTTLGDSDLVQSRLAVSLNLSFFDVLQQYPIGAGLASAFGTSVPYFLATAAGFRPQFGIENEYGHILLEQGIIGAFLWISFIIFSTFRKQRIHETSPTAEAFMVAIPAIMWAVSVMGVGTLYGIPSATMLFLIIGMRITNPIPKTSKRGIRHVGTQRNVARPIERVPALAARTAGR